MPAAESTPLLSQVNQAVAGLWTKQNVDAASAVVSERVAAVRTSMETGDFSLRLLVLLGGAGVIVTSFFDLIKSLFFLRFATALVEIFTIAFGCIILVLESRQLSLPPVYMEKVLKYALFLKFIWGRGVLYALAGSLLASQGSMMDFIVGCYMLFVGVLFIVLGYMTAKKLANVGRQSSFTTSTLRSKFRAANTDHSGKLDLAQFSALVDDLDIPLSKREKEIAFLYLDTTDCGTLTFDEFNAWFTQRNAAPIL